MKYNWSRIINVAGLGHVPYWDSKQRKYTCAGRLLQLTLWKRSASLQGKKSRSNPTRDWHHLLFKRTPSTMFPTWNLETVSCVSTSKTFTMYLGRGCDWVISRPAIGQLSPISPSYWSKETFTPYPKATGAKRIWGGDQQDVGFIACDWSNQSCAFIV